MIRLNNVRNNTTVVGVVLIFVILAINSAAKAEGDSTERNKKIVSTKNSKYKEYKKSNEKNTGGVESISVNGVQSWAGGSMKHQTEPVSQSSIGQKYISQHLGITSPLALVASSPGVNYGSTDPLGLANRELITIRGLDTHELGFVLDGMQGMDQAYYQPYMQTWADPENIEDITVIQGSSRIFDPTSTASGGEIIMTTRDPSDRYGGHLSFSAGSYRSRRVFARVDSGYIGNSGVKMFGSYSYTASDLFTGSGRNHKTQVDYKITKDWGDKSKSSLYVSYDNWYNPRLNTIPLSDWEKKNASGNNFSSGNLTSTYVPNQTKDYWKSYIYKNESFLASLQNKININNRVTLHFNPYFRWEATNAPGQANVSANSLYRGDLKETVNTSGVYFTNSNTRSFSAMSNTKQNIYAEGINLFLNIELPKKNRLLFGYWYDNFSLSQVGSLVPMEENGETANDFGAYPLRSTSGDIIAGSDYNIRQQSHAFYVSDTQAFFNNKLKISIGFREILNYIDGINYLPGNQRKFSNSFNAPMPRITISYDMTPNIQFYINGITNARAPTPSSSYVTTYNISSGKVVQQGLDSSKPEYTIGEEVGFRYHGKFQASVALFNMNLTHHQVSTLNTVNGALVNQALSVGGETIRGATVEVASHAYYGLSGYINAQYLHATMDNNQSYGGKIYNTSGKYMVNTPKFMANIGVNYQNGPFFANVSFKWVDSQYSTFMNDQTMPAYKTVDLGLGYRFPNKFGIHSPTLRLNFTNITNTRYLNYVASPTVSAAVSQPGYFFSAPMTAMMTASTDF